MSQQKTNKKFISLVIIAVAVAVLVVIVLTIPSLLNSLGLSHNDIKAPEGNYLSNSLKTSNGSQVGNVFNCANPVDCDKQTIYYVNTIRKPKVELHDYSYEGIDKDNAIISINNKTYYQMTLNYSVFDLPRGTTIKFQNVTFSFPEGLMITPGGNLIMLDVKFQDGYEEIYGEHKVFSDRSAAIGGIFIPTQNGPRIAINSTTVLGDHTMPQAGLTLFHDKIKLLVSTDH